MIEYEYNNVYYKTPFENLDSIDPVSTWITRHVSGIYELNFEIELKLLEIL